MNKNNINIPFTGRELH